MISSLTYLIGLIAGGGGSSRVGKLQPASGASLEMLCLRHGPIQVLRISSSAGPELLGAPVAAVGAILVVQTALLAAGGGCVTYEMCTYPALPARKAVTANPK